MSCVVQKSKLNLHDNARRDVGPEVNQAGRHWPRLEVLMSILNITQEVEKLARSEIGKSSYPATAIVTTDVQRWRRRDHPP